MVAGGADMPVVLPDLAGPDLDVKQLDVYINEEIINGVRAFICAACGWSTSRKSSVQRHLTTVHAPKLNLKCGVCRVAYKNEQAFQEHLRRKRCNEI